MERVRGNGEGLHRADVLVDWMVEEMLFELVLHRVEVLWMVERTASVFVSTSASMLMVMAVVTVNGTVHNVTVNAIGVETDPEMYTFREMHFVQIEFRDNLQNARLSQFVTTL